jgi:methylthioribose-1-phosphate isomerase
MIQPLFTENGKVRIVDQTLLPKEYKIIEIENDNEMAGAIKRLAVRGAPAIGIAAAFGLVLGLKRFRDAETADFLAQLERISAKLNATRPTAVNLSWALERMKAKAESLSHFSTEKIWEKLWREAENIHSDDIERCKKIGVNGSQLIPARANILTHCNAGGLATGGLGTALGVIITAHQSGRELKVYVDETRPLLQGARLTAWELGQENIHHEICTDNAAGFLMQQGKIDMVITGADRIATNGDSANKIGTYSLAVLAKYHHIPFYIAAPESTIDRKIATGNEIPIEFRHENEVKIIGGYTIAPRESKAVTPAFDVTPGKLISGIITEEKVYTYPYKLMI